MAKNVLARPMVRESVSRNPFDRSFERNQHCSHGQIVPIMMEPCIAGTKGVINRQVFTRTADIVSPAFPHVTQHFDFFKVPIRYLWSEWNDWKLNINDINSSALVDFSSLGTLSSIPRFNFGGDGSTGTFFSTMETAFATFASSVTIQQRAQFYNDMLRLFEPLGYGNVQEQWQQNVPVRANVKNLLPAAAYQKVYYDHYRNTSYESNNPYRYNLDWLTDRLNSRDGLLSVTQGPQDFDVFRGIFTLRYVNYRNDYFKNVYPALNYTTSSPQGINWSLPNIPGVATSNNASVFQIYNSSGEFNPRLFQSSGNFANNQNISVQSIRSLFALDKLMRASALAPKHVRDQFKARFGVDVGAKVSNESERIGSFSHDIIFGEVTNQADTYIGGANPTGSRLGAVGGKGVGASNYEKDLHFYCEEDCIIIGVTYFLVRGMYDCVPDEWNNKLVREEFFQPEFENLGLRPVYDLSGVNVIGYTVPNLRYKIGRDLNLGLFKRQYNVFDIDTQANKVNFHHSWQHPLRTFTVHSDNHGYTVSSPLNYLDFKAIPSDLDSIFVDSYSPIGAPEDDQFYFNFRIKFAVTAGMDVHGQPSMAML